MKIAEGLSSLDGKPIPIHREHFVVNFIAECDGNAQDVLYRVKEILTRVIDNELGFDDPVEKWKAILPDRFVDAAAPEMTRPDADALLARPDGYETLSKTWTISGFIHWFRPEMRSWYWQGCEVADQNNLSVQLLVYGHPIAVGALEWLFKICGALKFEEIVD